MEKRGPVVIQTGDWIAGESGGSNRNVLSLLLKQASRNRILILVF